MVVTGCLSGIGRATLADCAGSGANVFACALERTDEFEEYCRELATATGTRITPVYFDMADSDAVKRAAREIQSAKTDIHGLINIAGINRDAYFGMITERDLEETFRVNVFSVIIFTQYIVKLMLRAGAGGSIAFVSSVTALDGNEGQVAYGASKAALLGAVRSMAKELGKRHIRVNAVAPGVIKTPMTDKLSEELKAKKTECMDIKRLGEAGEVSSALVFLMSDMSSHITGQTLRIDGGLR